MSNRLIRLIEFSSERCAAPNLNADTVLATFARTCFEFHVTRGESFEKAQQICKSHGKSRSFFVHAQNRKQFAWTLIGCSLLSCSKIVIKWIICVFKRKVAFFFFVHVRVTHTN